MVGSAYLYSGSYTRIGIDKSQVDERTDERTVATKVPTGNWRRSVKTVLDLPNLIKKSG